MKTGADPSLHHIADHPVLLPEAIIVINTRATGHVCRLKLGNSYHRFPARKRCAPAIERSIVNAIHIFDNACGLLRLVGGKIIAADRSAAAVYPRLRDRRQRGEVIVVAHFNFRCRNIISLITGTIWLSSNARSVSRAFRKRSLSSISARVNSICPMWIP